MSRIYVSGQFQGALDATMLRAYSQELRRGLAFRQENKSRDDSTLWDLLASLTGFSDILAGMLGLKQIQMLENVLATQGILSPAVIAVYLFIIYKQRKEGKPVDERLPKWIRDLVERVMDGDTKNRADPGNDVHG